jgi:hypothetical protein
MAFCANCGTKSVDGGRFCQNCGTPVAGAPSAAPVSQTQKPPPPYPGPPQQQDEKAPPGHFKVQLPLTGAVPGQMMQVQVPKEYPQAGQWSTFRIPPGSQPGGHVYAPLPTGGGAGGQFNAPYGGNGGYNNGGYPQYQQGPPQYQQGPPQYQQGPPQYQQGPPQYQQNTGMGAGTTALAAGAGVLGGWMLADAIFD